MTADAVPNRRNATLFHSRELFGEINKLPLRLLANLGDAVCGLYEKERAIATCSSAGQMHSRVKARINAKAQAQFLARLQGNLSEAESDLVRRARNLKTAHYGKVEQSTYRQSTAFETLVGFLYLSEPDRLREIFALLEMTASDSDSPTKP